MEIINEFGFDPLILGAQIINFLIIFYVLKRFAFKPILEILRNREKIIKDGLRDAEEGQRKLEEASEKKKSILRNAQSRAEVIIEEAHLQAKEIIEASDKKSKAISEEMIMSAKSQIAQDYKNAERNLGTQISEIAVDFLEKSLTGLFGDIKQRELMQIVIKKIKSTN